MGLISLPFLKNDTECLVFFFVFKSLRQILSVLYFGIQVNECNVANMILKNKVFFFLFLCLCFMWNFFITLIILIIITYLKTREYYIHFSIFT